MIRLDGYYINNDFKRLQVNDHRSAPQKASKVPRIDEPYPLMKSPLQSRKPALTLQPQTGKMPALFAVHRFWGTECPVQCSS
ncbi:MAG: hypothetical protein ABSE19_12345 [Candidatus Acidiferrum sp.]|jgi:hypothetical protein